MMRRRRGLGKRGEIADEKGVSILEEIRKFKISFTNQFPILNLFSPILDRRKLKKRFIMKIFLLSFIKNLGSIWDCC